MLAKHNEAQNDAESESMFTDDAGSVSGKTFNTWATNYTDCTNATFSKVHRYWHSNSAQHKEVMVHVHFSSRLSCNCTCRWCSSSCTVCDETRKIRKCRLIDNDANILSLRLSDSLSMKTSDQNWHQTDNFWLISDSCSPRRRHGSDKDAGRE